MPDEKTKPDELIKTLDDDIKLTEGQLDDVSGGVQKVREPSAFEPSTLKDT